MTSRESELRHKASFVENELSEALNAATYGFAQHCMYLVDGPEEYVTVVLDQAPGELHVNVTSDSRWAILKDVMKAVTKRFE